MKRTLAILGILVLVMVALGLWVTRDKTEAPPTVAPPAPSVSNVAPVVASDAAPTGEPEVRILRQSGDVRVRTGEGDWEASAPGQQLPVSAEVETGIGARVSLQIGELSTVDMMDSSRVTVRELSDSVQRMGLLGGRVSVNYEEKGERVLMIENASGTASARVRQGKFSMTNNGTVIAVATETGSVDLTSAGKTVAVVSGLQASASDGEVPTQPGTISPQLILRLSDKACTRQKGTAVKVRGSVAPGTRVFVNQQPAKVNATGQFVADLQLERGKSNILIETEDVVGRRTTRSVSCVIVEPGEPDAREVDFKWGVTKGKKAS
ncbi:MAG: FecR family protein [Proteobacteria bacterium]|nr:FecR family protein [Pseudomonadota bacterium]